MCLARPITTVSVTVTSGCSSDPDFSAYLRAYAHILSTFAFEGSAIRDSPLRAPRALSGLGERGVDRLGVEPGELFVSDEQHGQRQQAERHQFLAGLGVTPDVLLGERYALL